MHAWCRRIPRPRNWRDFLATRFGLPQEFRSLTCEKPGDPSGRRLVFTAIAKGNLLNGYEVGTSGAVSVVSESDGYKGAYVNAGKTSLSFLPFMEGVVNTPYRDTRDFGVMGNAASCVRCAVEPAPPCGGSHDGCCPHNCSSDPDCAELGHESCP